MEHPNNKQLNCQNKNSKEIIDDNIMLNSSGSVAKDEKEILTSSTGIKLATKLKFEVRQAILGEIKIILTIDDDVLREQQYYWIKPINPVEDLDQQTEIKVALENHWRTPANWISPNELEVNIDPDARILNIKK